MTDPIDDVPPVVVARAKEALAVVRARRIIEANERRNRWRDRILPIAVAVVAFAVVMLLALLFVTVRDAGASHIKWVTPMYGTPMHMTH